MKFDQDLCLKCDMISRCYFGKMNSILGSVVPLAMFCLFLNRTKQDQALLSEVCGKLWIFIAWRKTKTRMIENKV